MSDSNSGLLPLSKWSCAPATRALFLEYADAQFTVVAPHALHAFLRACTLTNETRRIIVAELKRVEVKDAGFGKGISEEQFALAVRMVSMAQANCSLDRASLAAAEHKDLEPPQRNTPAGIFGVERKMRARRPTLHRPVFRPPPNRPPPSRPSTASSPRNTVSDDTRPAIDIFAPSQELIELDSAIAAAISAVNTTIHKALEHKEARDNALYGHHRASMPPEPAHTIAVSPSQGPRASSPFPRPSPPSRPAPRTPVHHKHAAAGEESAAEVLAGDVPINLAAAPFSPASPRSPSLAPNDNSPDILIAAATSPSSLLRGFSFRNSPRSTPRSNVDPFIGQNSFVQNDRSTQDSLTPRRARSDDSSSRSTPRGERNFSPRAALDKAPDSAAAAVAAAAAASADDKQHAQLASGGGGGLASPSAKTSNVRSFVGMSELCPHQAMKDQCSLCRMAREKEDHAAAAPAVLETNAIAPDTAAGTSPAARTATSPSHSQTGPVGVASSSAASPMSSHVHPASPMSAHSAGSPMSAHSAGSPMSAHSAAAPAANIASSSTSSSTSLCIHQQVRAVCMLCQLASRQAQTGSWPHHGGHGRRHNKNTSQSLTPKQSKSFLLQANTPNQPAKSNSENKTDEAVSGLEELPNESSPQPEPYKRLSTSDKQSTKGSDGSSPRNKASNRKMGWLIGEVGMTASPVSPSASSAASASPAAANATWLMGEGDVKMEPIKALDAKAEEASQRKKLEWLTGEDNKSKKEKKEEEENDEDEIHVPKGSEIVNAFRRMDNTLRNGQQPGKREGVHEAVTSPSLRFYQRGMTLRDIRPKQYLSQEAQGSGPSLSSAQPTESASSVSKASLMNATSTAAQLRRFLADTSSKRSNNKPNSATGSSTRSLEISATSSLSPDTSPSVSVEAPEVARPVSEDSSGSEHGAAGQQASQQPTSASAKPDTLAMPGQQTRSNDMEVEEEDDSFLEGLPTRNYSKTRGGSSSWSPFGEELEGDHISDAEWICGLCNIVNQGVLEDEACGLCGLLCESGVKWTCGVCGAVRSSSFLRCCEGGLRGKPMLVVSKVWARAGPNGSANSLQRLARGERVTVRAVRNGWVQHGSGWTVLKDELGALLAAAENASPTPDANSGDARKQAEKVDQVNSLPTATRHQRSRHTGMQLGVLDLADLTASSFKLDRRDSHLVDVTSELSTNRAWFRVLLPAALSHLPFVEIEARVPETGGTAEIIEKTLATLSDRDAFLKGEEHHVIRDFVLLDPDDPAAAGMARPAQLERVASRDRLPPHDETNKTAANNAVNNAVNHAAPKRRGGLAVFKEARELILKLASEMEVEGEEEEDELPASGSFTLPLFSGQADRAKNKESHTLMRATTAFKGAVGANGKPDIFFSAGDVVQVHNKFPGGGCVCSLLTPDAAAAATGPNAKQPADGAQAEKEGECCWDGEVVYGMDTNLHRRGKFPRACVEEIVVDGKHTPMILSLYIPSLFGLFKKHCEKEFSEENIAFWLALQEYRSLAQQATRGSSSANNSNGVSLAQVKEKADYVMEQFVRGGAPQSVNVDSRTRDRVKTKLRQTFDNTGETREDPADVFVLAETVILKLVSTDSFSRFCKTAEFQDWVEAYKQPISARYELFIELLDSERRYVNQLQQLMVMFSKPLHPANERSKSPLTLADHQGIFGQLASILPINFQFLEDLEGKRRGWTRYTEQAICIGPMLHTYSQLFKIYKVFVATSEIRTDLFQKLLSHKNFKKFLSKVEEQHGLVLQKLLEEPEKRMRRYEVLVSEMVRQTPRLHADYADLQKASQEFKALARGVHSEMTTRKRRDKVLEIQEQFNPPLPFTLVTPSRFFLHRDTVYIKDTLLTLSAKEEPIKGKYVLIFNDLLLVAQVNKDKRKEDTYKYLESFPIDRTLTITALTLRAADAPKKPKLNKTDADVPLTRQLRVSSEALGWSLTLYLSEDRDVEHLAAPLQEAVVSSQEQISSGVGSPGIADARLTAPAIKRSATRINVNHLSVRTRNLKADAAGIIASPPLKETPSYLRPTLHNVFRSTEPRRVTSPLSAKNGGKS